MITRSTWRRSSAGAKDGGQLQQCFVVLVRRQLHSANATGNGDRRDAGRLKGVVSAAASLRVLLLDPRRPRVAHRRGGRGELVLGKQLVHRALNSA
jgi:hypothetical protein